MIFRIKKGKHRARPLRLWLWYKKRTINRKVTFHQSCKYLFDGEDMLDTNKLFGIGFLWNHHQDSARFGWRYDSVKDKFIVSAYCYVNGQRIIEDLCELIANRTYEFILSEITGEYYFYVAEREKTFGPDLLDFNIMIAQKFIPFTHNKKWSFPLGFYFGGNKPAPHTMTIKIEKS